MTINKIKISKDTVKLLKNFASINKTMCINGMKDGETGTNIKITSSEKNIVSYAKVPEQFPIDAPIYDLSVLLNVLTQFEEPSVEFDDNKLTITADNFSTTIWYAANELVIKIPEKETIQANLPAMEVSFDFSEANFNKMVAMANTLGLEHIVVRCKDNAITIVVTDRGNNQSPEFELRVSDYAGEDKEFFFRLDSFKILPGDYTFSICKDVISHLKSKTIDGLEYFLALEN